MAALSSTLTRKTPRRITKPQRKVTKARTSAAARRPDSEVNLAPQSWGRRVARLVGEQCGVKMVSNRSKNEGQRGEIHIAIKCAKSIAAPIFISVDMLGRIDEVWGVFLIYGEGAQIWSCPVAHIKRAAHFSRNPKTMPRAEITLKKLQRGGKLIGHLLQEDIESCHIP